MKEIPILFSTPMVQALLDGRKTMTRRIIKKQPPEGYNRWHKETSIHYQYENDDPPLGMFTIKCPYGQPGDILWVRETFYKPPFITDKMLRTGADTWDKFYYESDEHDKEQLIGWGWKKKPSIHIPREAARIFLEVVSVRVERVQEISDDDCKREGWGGFLNSIVPGDDPFCAGNSRKDWFVKLWKYINGKGSWEANPWVWVIEFKRRGDYK